MEYEPIEGGQLQIEVRGTVLDLYALGVLQINLQDIIDKVAFWALAEQGLLDPTWRRAKYLPQRVYPSRMRFIRAEVRDIREGSLFETVSFALAVAIAEPDIRAVLQNLAAQVVWAIAASGVSSVSVSGILRGGPWQLRRRRDPIDVGPNLREVILALAEHPAAERVELRLRSTGGQQEQAEVVLKVGGNERQRQR
jgi:hypothetical protein